MRILIAFVFTLCAITLPATVASAQAPSCHIGKPSYCGKYGGAICEKTNSKAACIKWTAACGACHAEIPRCLGNKRPASTSPVCTTCTTNWRSCMQKIDRRYWPERQSPN